jgi:uncharacterized repeat protein (TIGR01451 family)
MKKSILTLFVLLFINSLWGQSWITTFRDTALYVHDILELENGDYLISSEKKVSEQILTYLDKNGKVKWRRSYLGAAFSGGGIPRLLNKSFDEGFILNVASAYSNKITKFNKNGDVIWSIVDRPIAGITTLPNNDVVCIEPYLSPTNNGILRLVNSATGQLVISKVLDARPVSIFSDNRFIYVLTENSFLRFSHDLTLVDSKILDKKPLYNPYGKNIRLDDGGFAYFDNTSPNPNLIKIDSTGQLLWKKQIDSTFFIKPCKGGLMFIKDKGSNTKITKIANNGVGGWSKNYIGKSTNRVPYPYGYAAIVTKSGDIIFGITNEYDVTTNSNTIEILKLSQWDINPESHISGKVFRKNNCQDATPIGTLSGITVKADNGKGTEFWATTDTLGRYTILCDTGSYKVNVIKQSELWQVCQNDFTVKAGDTLNFSINATSLCPALTTDISTPFLRRCFENTYYVKYCNNGTLLAPNAFVEVTLDSLMDYRSANRSLIRRDGRKLYFNVGDLGVNECGTFNVTVYVKCGDSTRLNQTLCVKSHIFPDSICKKPVDWSGASLTISGVCERDSVRFLIKNEGVAPSSILKSVVIEDHVMFLRAPVQLGVGATKTIKVPSNGSTWRMSVQQEPNHPTSIAPTAFVEGCRSNTTQTFRTGFVTGFDEDDATPSVDADCQVIIGAYDPNDKTGYPTGYEKDNFIDQNQDIEYLIRFQNTGTDTAFNIVVVDTLPPQLEFANIQFGASSHKYSAELQGKGIIKFSFNNINLVDSFKNEAKSHGFAKFTIQQKKDVALGTKIKNNAAIYFDFNAPIFTNTTLHTIGKPILAAIFDKVLLPMGSIKMYPNPMRESAVFEVKDYPLSIKAKFHLFDALGRTLRVENFIGERLDFQRNGLEQGIYFFKIEDDGQLLGSGKLIVQ